MVNTLFYKTRKLTKPPLTFRIDPTTRRRVFVFFVLYIGRKYRL